MLCRRVFSPTHYVKVHKYRYFSQHYPIVSQWSKCQRLQIMSSQCLETQTVTYRSIFLVFLHVSFHTARLPLPRVSKRVHPTEEPVFPVGLSHLGNSHRSTYQPRKRLPGYLSPTCPGRINTKEGEIGELPTGQLGRVVLPWIGIFLFSSFFFFFKKKIYFLNNNKCT